MQNWLKAHILSAIKAKIAPEQNKIADDFLLLHNN